MFFNLRKSHKIIHMEIANLQLKYFQISRSKFPRIMEKKFQEAWFVGSLQVGILFIFCSTACFAWDFSKFEELFDGKHFQANGIPSGRMIV